MGCECVQTSGQGPAGGQGFRGVGGVGEFHGYILRAARLAFRSSILHFIKARASTFTAKLKAPIIDSG